MSLAFDTLAYANKLKKAGIPSAQAEIQSEVLAETFAEAMGIMIDNTLATKNDIQTVRIEIKELENRLTLRFGSMLVASAAILSTLMVILHVH